MNVAIYNENGFTKVENRSRVHYQSLTTANERKYSSRGKYLIFSKNRSVLIKIGDDICKEFNLSVYWVSIDAKGKGDFAYVCQIHDVSNRYKHQIKLFIDRHNYDVTYRYFKKQELTDMGIYSEEYLKSSLGRNRSL